MAVSSEGFVAVMTGKESPRAMKLVVTPDDPMSGGLDVEQAETSEARTLLQLMQVHAFRLVFQMYRRITVAFVGGCWLFVVGGGGSGLMNRSCGRCSVCHIIFMAYRTVFFNETSSCQQYLLKV